MEEKTNEMKIMKKPRNNLGFSYIFYKMTEPNSKNRIRFRLVHRKVAEVHTLIPPSKPIIFRKNRGFWGIFALFFNFAQNSIWTDYVEPTSAKVAFFTRQ